MKTHQTKRTYRVRCRSGRIGWRMRLRNVYASEQDFCAYSNIYNLAFRLGFDSAAAAWRCNPVVEGSTNPADFRKVKA